MSPVVHLEWWRQKNADRLRFEEEQRSEIIGSLVPHELLLKDDALSIRYALSKDTPPDLLPRIMQNPAWALNLFSAIRSVSFSFNSVRIAKVKSVRVSNSVPRLIEAAFKVHNRGDDKLEWRIKDPATLGPKADCLAYEFI